MTAPDRPFCPPDMLVLANAMADAVRPVIRKYFRTRLAVDAKGDASPVTIADREAETLMRDMIIARFPEHGIRGEEFAVFQADAEWVWVLDPIDGTKSFVSGSLAFGTQITLLHRGQPVLGIIDQPITQERWLGEAGKGTVLNGMAIHCSDTKQIAEAVIYTSALDHFDAEQRKRFNQLAGKVRYHSISHDCCAAGLLALGGVDLLLESNVHDYDILPQMPIVKGAGGIVADWEGQPLADGRQFKTVLMAANPQLHSAALKMLRGKGYLHQSATATRFWAGWPGWPCGGRMSKKQSGAVLTLVSVDRQSTVPLFRQLETQARQSFRSGMGYADPAGFAKLRSAIADYLALHRGDYCDPERIAITSGGARCFHDCSLVADRSRGSSAV